VPKIYYILDKNEDLFALLEESMANISNILGSRYCNFVKDDVNIKGQVTAFYAKLQYFESLLEEWQ